MDLTLRISFTCILYLISHTTLALPKPDPVPGGVVLINIEINDSIAPRAYFNKRQLMVRPQNGAWLAVLGLPLTTRAGRHTIDIAPSKGKSFTLGFEVLEKEYEAQYITIKNKRKVNPNKKDLQRIIKEKKEMVQVYRSWTAQNTDVTSFIRPAEGPYSSPFGLKRFFNKQARAPHSGVDIAAPKGSPILSPAEGTVKATGHYFFNGKTVLIDHGQGLVTMFCHMSQVNVQLGQRIKQGEQVGEVGQTGRATGPHLHWSVSLNNARVNPLLFME